MRRKIYRERKKNKTLQATDFFLNLSTDIFFFLPHIVLKKKGKKKAALIPEPLPPTQKKQLRNKGDPLEGDRLESHSAKE